MSEYRELSQRVSEAHKRRQLMQNVYEDVMALAIPNRQAWNTQTEGRDVQRNIFDSTLQLGLERLANALYTGMFPPHLEWIELHGGTDTPPEDKDAILAFLQEGPAKVLRQEFLDSNFYAEVHPWLGNLVIGTGVMLIDEVVPTELDPNPTHDVNFETLPLEECGLEPGRGGKVEGLFRKHRMTARQFMADFPDATISQKVMSAWEKDPDGTWVEIDNCVYREIKGKHEWVQKIMYPEQQEVVWETRFFTQPFVAPRWSKMPNEIFGRGPACTASADAYSLNEGARLELIAANIELFGMWTTTDDGINQDTLELGPGVLIPVDSNSQQDPTLRPLDLPQRSGMALQSMERKESSVKQALIRDNLAAIEGSDMTATEVMERQALVAQDMGPAFGRINAEGTDIMVARVIDILSRRGKMPPLRVDGKQVAIKYVSPLARALEMEEVQAIRMLVADAGSMMAIDPAAGARIDTGKALRSIAVKSGAPLDIIRDDAEVEEIMTKAAVAEQEMAAQQEVV
jgi:hypothetical protein